MARPARLRGAQLDASPAAVYSALQRAHRTIEERGPQRSRQETLRALGDDAVRELAGRYADAWEREDVEAIVAMLTQDAVFTMPPRPGWYRGREAIGAFLARGPLSLHVGWRHVPADLNGQPGFMVFAGGIPHAAEVLTLSGDSRIAAVTAFHRPGPLPA